ncbi:lysis protein [Xenorhabdus griffiniae]|uniref:lysis protein n=1 Tax=Xenorhabdus griffiniae TaxID=351672 RepID=UPI0023598BEE|nr:lysis protein [Xenorhabdus griffiniae]MDC9607337.1 lysis protein [Xenorhabdus griffiniae]
MTAYEKVVLVIIAGLIAWSSWLMASLNEVNDLNKKLTTDFNEQVAINTRQQERIQQLHELDTKHTQELAHAKTEIDILRADVAAGRRKLRIKAACTVSETVTSSSVGATTAVELTGETGQAVLDIREGIINDRAKLSYLQEYVRTECGVTK